MALQDSLMLEAHGREGWIERDFLLRQNLREACQNP
jgi:hypothetical protein